MIIICIHHDKLKILEIIKLDIPSRICIWAKIIVRRIEMMKEIPFEKGIKFLNILLKDITKNTQRIIVINKTNDNE
jgi:hypothetical protein